MFMVRADAAPLEPVRPPQPSERTEVRRFTAVGYDPSGHPGSRQRTNDQLPVVHRP
jgi:hypothetical protein